MKQFAFVFLTNLINFGVFLYFISSLITLFSKVLISYLSNFASFLQFIPSKPSMAHLTYDCSWSRFIQLMASLLTVTECWMGKCTWAVHGSPEEFGALWVPLKHSSLRSSACGHLVKISLVKAAPGCQTVACPGVHQAVSAA